MIFNVSRRILLAIFAIAVIVPTSIVVLGTFKSDFEIYSKPLALPKVFNLNNFKALFETGNIATPFKNSVIVSIGSVFFTLLFASLAAYSISRMFTITGKVLFFLFSLGLAIPGQVNIVPIYTLFVKLGLTNSLTGLILVNIALNLPLSIFILTAFLKDLPKEMFEVASIAIGGDLPCPAVAVVFIAEESGIAPEAFGLFDRAEPHLVGQPGERLFPDFGLDDALPRTERSAGIGKVTLLGVLVSAAQRSEEHTSELQSH